MKRELTQARLKELLRYDRRTGVFTRLVSHKRALVGKPTGRITAKGYRRICVDGRHYLAGRLAWLYVKGEWPVAQIDHRDGNRANDAFRNLRQATQTQNNANRRTNKSKRRLKGVFYREDLSSKPYEASITVNGLKIHLGRHETEIDAHAAYTAAAKSFFGEFARAA